jgi:hypothetical protein
MLPLRRPEFLMLQSIKSILHMKKVGHTCNGTCTWYRYFLSNLSSRVEQISREGPFNMVGLLCFHAGVAPLFQWMAGRLTVTCR